MLDYIFQGADFILGDIAVENLVSLAQMYAEKAGITERITDSDDFFPAYLNYKGPLKQLCKDLNKNYNHIHQALGSCEKMIGHTYEKPTSLSSEISQFFGIGAYLLAGGGILGAGSQFIANKMVEPLIRKAQHYVFEEQFSEEDSSCYSDIDDIDEDVIESPRLTKA